MKLSEKEKHILMVGLVFTGLLIALPLLMLALMRPRAGAVEQEKGPQFVAKAEEEAATFLITVYRTETSEFQEIEFERYLIGVVAAEMPALFEPDALRAQAIAARTYAMRILEHDDYILDTVMHQVFLDDAQLRTRWGDAFDVHFASIEEAVMSTQGIVLTYEDELITPMFFSMSNGATENSEDVFSSARPYLRSVSSSGYEDHERFAVDEGFGIESLREAFGDETLTAQSLVILETSEGGSVTQIQVGSEVLSGRHVREVLGLRSASFSIEVVSDGVVFTTYGNGHGVGMSQHGANVMAQNGYDYREILQHFYQDVTLSKMEMPREN